MYLLQRSSIDTIKEHHTPQQIHTMDADGKELLVPVNNVSEDMDIRRAWSLFGVELSETSD
jgi:hypothetical protein